MVDPSDLVVVARLLISTSSGDAALRRSVSTAYYAMFHALAGFAADRLIAPRDATAAYALVYRGLDHKRIKDVFEDVAKPTLRAAVRRALGRATMSVGSRQFAETFVRTQQLRHVADYHPSFDLSLSDVGDFIDEVERALTGFSAIDRAEMTDIVSLMLVGARS